MTSHHTVRLCCARAIGRQEIDLDLLLLDTALSCLLDVTPDLADVAAVGSSGVWGDGDGLYEELVAAARIGGGLLFHRLQEDLHFDICAGLDFAAVRSHAVSTPMSVGVFGGCRWNAILLRRCGLDFEGYGVAAWVAKAEDLRYFVVEGAWDTMLDVVFRLAMRRTWYAYA